MRYVPVVLLSLGLVMGCGSEGGGSSQDAGTTPDAGTKADAGTGTAEDAGTSQDAGTKADAGTGTAEDAGTTVDAGSVADAGTSADAGTTEDAGTSTPPTPCGIPYLGDPSGPIDFTPTAIGPNSTSSPLSAGSIVSIIEPLQGGRVSFIGVRDATNMNPCGAYLIGSLRDPVSGRRQTDGRTINLQRGTDGKGYTPDADDASFSNVTLCPNNWSSQDLYDQDYELTVILKDRDGKALQKVLMVRPACNVPGEDAVCRCMCKQGYVTGSTCP